MQGTMYQAGTLERLVLSDRILVTYVPLPATSSESVRRNPYERSSYLYGFDDMPPSVTRGQYLKVIHVLA